MWESNIISFHKLQEKSSQENQGKFSEQLVYLHINNPFNEKHKKQQIKLSPEAANTKHPAKFKTVAVEQASLCTNIGKSQLFIKKFCFAFFQLGGTVC